MKGSLERHLPMTPHDDAWDGMSSHKKARESAPGPSWERRQNPLTTAECREVPLKIVWESRDIARCITARIALLHSKPLAPPVLLFYSTCALYIRWYLV